MEETTSDGINDVEVIFETEPIFTAIQPPSPSPSPKQEIKLSPRSQHNSYVKQKEEEEEKPKIHVHIVTPEKVGEGLMKAHVEYKLQIKTSLSQYKSNEFSCIRRYKDFLWLRTQLLEHHKGYMIPPLPEKQIINRFNAEFIEYRRRELERFLCRVIAHPVLITSSSLQTFLEAENLVHGKETKPAERKASGSGGFFSMLGSGIESISSGFAVQFEPDQWFDAKKNYIIALENQLNTLSKSANMLVKKQKELSQVYTDFGLSSSLLASTEADHSAWISNSFNKLAEMSTSVSNLHESLIDNETVYFEDSLRDYVRIIGAAKEMLNGRTEKLGAYQNASKQLEIRKDKLEKSKGNSKLAKEVEEHEKKLEDAKNEFLTISDICKSELLRFESTKAQEIKKILVKFTQTNINFGLQVMDQWKQFLANELSLEIDDPSLKINVPTSS